MINTVEVFGTPYEMGYQIGVLFKKHLKKAIKKYDKQIKNKYVAQKVQELSFKLSKEFPDGYDEIKGRADGAGLDLDATMLMFFRDLNRLTTGCTTVMMKDGDGRMLFSHNEDDGGFTEENVALVKYNYGTDWVIGYTHAEHLIGCFFAYNSSGLLFSSNNISTYETRIDNLTRYVLERSCLRARSITEVKSILKEMKVASPFSMNICDTRKQTAVNVEKDFEDMYVTSVKDRYARSNHFLKKKGDVKISESSLFRYENSKELTDKLDRETVTREDLVKILSYRTDDGLKSTLLDTQEGLGGNRTVANLSYDVDKKQIHLIDYVGNHEFIFEYGSLEDLNHE